MKNKRELKYIGFYNDNYFNLHENRNTSLAVKNKMDYICSALTRNNLKVKIISPCWTNNTKGFFKGKEYIKSNYITIKNFATFGSNNKVLQKINKFFIALQLLLYLIINTKRNEEILVYHSLALILPIKIAKKIKNLSLILEVEEIYSTVWKGTYDVDKEISYINMADKAIFASDQLQNYFKINKSVVVYGSYNYYDKKNFNKKFKKNIDIVYAGSIDKIKGGAKNSVLAMNYLPNKYRLHILGFGINSDIEELKKLINYVNKEKGYECCRFYGSLDGEKYSEFLLNCDIGLNPQKEGEYMDFAFPSKILSYLSHGLQVVSTKISSVINSKISSHIVFSENDDPKAIAEAILKTNIPKKYNKNIVKELDKKFVCDLANLLKL